MNLGRSLSTEQLLQRDVSLSSMRGSGRGQRQGSRAASAPAGCTTVIDLTGETEFEKLCDEPQTRAVDPTRSHHERAVNKVAQHEVNEVNSLNQNSSAVIHTAGEVNATVSAEQHHNLLPHLNRPPTSTPHFARVLSLHRIDSNVMDNHPFLNYPHPDRDAFGGGEDIMRGLGNGHQRGLTVDVLPGNIKDKFPSTPITPTIVAHEVNQLRTEVQAAQNIGVVNQQQIRQLFQTIQRLQLSENQVLQFLNTLNARVVRIEADNASLRNENASVRNENASLRNQLASQGGLSAGDTRPAVPQSPGVFSVRTFQEQLDALDESSEEDGEENDSQTPVRDATEQTETKPNLLRASYPKKRKIHNTMTLLPPGMALIPQLPLTDKEIIVYFFNSIARPEVTFRLYTRGWGPARIVDTLNFHRSITPKYLRNTCSVKCTTARKRGIERHGQAWAENLHNAFRASENDNLAATRLLDFDDSEKDQVQDVDLLDCVRGLRHHPLENAEGEDITVRGEMSIFAKCVFWCQKNGVGCRISEAHILAAKLQSGEFTLDDGNEGAGPISPRKKMALVKALKGNGQASAGPSSAPHTPVRNTVEQDVSSDDGDDEAEPMETCTSETEEANEENDEDARSEFSDLSDISSTLNFPTH